MRQKSASAALRLLIRLYQRIRSLTSCMRLIHESAEPRRVPIGQEFIMTVMLDNPPTLEHENLWKADRQWRSGHQPVGFRHPELVSH